MRRSLVAVALVALAGCSSGPKKTEGASGPSAEQLVAAVAPKLKAQVAAFDFPKTLREDDGKVRVRVGAVRNNMRKSFDTAKVQQGLRQALDETGKVQTMGEGEGRTTPAYTMTASLDDFLHGDGAQPGEAGVRIEVEIVTTAKNETVMGAEATVGATRSQELSGEKCPATAATPKDEDLVDRAVAKLEAAFAKLDLPPELPVDADHLVHVEVRPLENRSREHVNTVELADKVKRVLVGSRRCKVTLVKGRGPRFDENVPVMTPLIDEHDGMLRARFRLDCGSRTLLDVVHEETAP